MLGHNYIREQMKKNSYISRIHSRGWGHFCWEPLICRDAEHSWEGADDPGTSRNVSRWSVANSIKGKEVGIYDDVHCKGAGASERQRKRGGLEVVIGSKDNMEPDP